jgi:hypothetical protein
MWQQSNTRCKVRRGASSVLACMPHSWSGAVYCSRRLTSTVQSACVPSPVLCSAAVWVCFRCFHCFVCERHGRYFCEKCACKVDALKGLKIEKFPPILTFQLKRYCRLILQLWLGPLALPSSLYVLSLEPLPAGLLSLELLPFVVTFRRTRAAA